MGITHHLVHPLSSRRGTFQCWRGGGVGEGRRGRKHCFLPPWGFSSGLRHSIPTPPLICHFIEQLVLTECTWAETPPHIGPGQCFVSPPSFIKNEGSPCSFKMEVLGEVPRQISQPSRNSSALAWHWAHLPPWGTASRLVSDLGLRSQMTVLWACQSQSRVRQRYPSNAQLTRSPLSQGAGSLPSFQDWIVSVPLPH